MHLLVSIIIPCYNAINTLQKLVENLKQLDFENYEVILVDDGSTDNSSSFFKRLYPEAVIIKQSNHGLAHARNIGAKNAKGKYLQFIDADDTIHPSKIKKQLAVAEKHEIDVVYSDWRMVLVDGNGNEIPENWVLGLKQDDYIESLLKGWWNPFHSYLFRKDSYLKIGGSNSSLTNAQDFDLVLKMAIEGLKFYYLPGLFSNYYRYLDQKSLARGSKERYWRNTETVIFNAIEKLNKSNELSLSYKKAAALRLFYIARNVYKFDLNWNKKLIKEILNLDPSFKPVNESWKFKILYSFFGYQTSENIITLFRRKLNNAK